jgi:hypothetical protein
VRRLAALAAALCLTAAGVAEAKRVRVFAVGPKLDLGWVDTRTHFHDHLLGLVDKAKRGADVQPEADDVASHLLEPASERNLVTLPEDLGLMTIFTGSRGQMARGASGVIEAIAYELVAYGPQSAYYSSKYPSLGGRGIPTRALGLAATDTFARVAVETYAEIARTYGVWLEAGVNMAQSWQVVCQSRATMPELPSGDVCMEENPGKVSQLQTTDEPERTYAYEATSDKTSNMALVFSPKGQLVSKQVKTYLTPVELPEQLDLAPGEVFTGLSALPTPVGTLGFVTSKDAWMPDVTARLDQARVDLLVQPEFFVGDTIRTTGPWAPDNITGAGFSDVLRHPSIEAMVMPEMTGNLFDLSADNQQQIAVKPRGRRPAGFLLGQPSAPGWLRTGAWVAPDPARKGETIAQRRKRLGNIGEQLLPDAEKACPTPAARGICRGGQVEDVIFADVNVARAPKVHRQKRRKRGRTPFSVNRPLAPAGRPQRNVALAARGKLVVAAYEQRNLDGDNVVVAASKNGGRTWGKPVTVAAGEHVWWPSVAIGPDRTIWLAWCSQGQPSSRPIDSTPAGGGIGVGNPFQGTFRVKVARSTDGGRGFSPPVEADASVGKTVWQLKPAIAATGPDRAVVAFVDDRARFTGDDLPQAGIWLVPLEGAKPGEAIRMDSTAEPNKLAATLDNAWAPALASRGRQVALTWIDFRDYEWNAYRRVSKDGGATWDVEQAVNDTKDSDEALEDTPRPAWPGPVIAFTDWAKSADSAKKASPLYDIRLARPGKKPAVIDGSRGAHVNAFAPAVVRSGARSVVAWQDHRRGQADILVTSGGAPRRVDDSGAKPWNQWRPALVLAGGTVVAAWEDERDGPSQIFFARAPVRRIG